MNPMANQMSDQAIATDLLLSAKAGVRNAAYALTEATSEDVRKTLNQELQQAVIFQQRVADYMITQGYYQPHNLDQQIQVDKMTAQSVIQYGQQQNQAMGNQPMMNQNTYSQQAYNQQTDPFAEQIIEAVAQSTNSQQQTSAQSGSMNTSYPSSTLSGNTTSGQQTDMDLTTDQQQTQLDQPSYGNQTATNITSSYGASDSDDSKFQMTVETDDAEFQMTEETDDDNQFQMTEESEQTLQLPEGQEKPPWKL